MNRQAKKLFKYLGNLRKFTLYTRRIELLEKRLGRLNILMIQTGQDTANPLGDGLPKMYSRTQNAQFKLKLKANKLERKIIKFEQSRWNVK